MDYNKILTYDERRYYTTLKLIMLRAASDVLKDIDVEIRHSVNHSIYCELKRDTIITACEVEKLKIRMSELISANYDIKLLSTNYEKLKREGDTGNRGDIEKIFNTVAFLPIRKYELDGYSDYFYEELYPTTGDIYLFDLEKYSHGFIIKYPPPEEQHNLHDVILMPKLLCKQSECKFWEKKMDVSYLGSLNEKILSGEFIELIRINEALHESNIAKITKDIVSNPDYKLVTIAGPSSSGKTTFSKKLSLFLKANGVFPIVISLDSYYIGRANIPLDENGEKDFESIEGLDLELLNDNLVRLINNEEVEIPEYDFVTGERKPHGTLVKVPEGGIIIIEGIHGLNERLTSHIPRNEKYKIYISCLTQLNIDMHNRIPTNGVRKIRRIVRDSLSRATSAEGTLEMWNSVRRGEEKNIFPYQEEADVMFDSNLVYELAVLKPFAIKELIKIKVGSPHYEEAKRLLRFLYCFLDIDDKYVPDTSILKEFIGGSYFYNY